MSTLELRRPNRRIVAIVLPELLCELAAGTGSAASRVPRAVVVTDPAAPAAVLGATTVIDAVNVKARQLGVRPGQTLAEARALSARLVVHPLTRERILEELGRVAEAALTFGAPVSIELPGPCPTGSAADTVWLDITGSVNLFGGEAAVITELSTLVRDLGHVVRIAAAVGPRLAQALARWSAQARRLDSSHPVDTSAQIRGLPVVALPIDSERASWLVRVGVLTVGDLADLPRAAAAARLGEHAGEVLELCAGRDPAPLVAYAPTRVLVEETSFDDPVVGSQPLLFAVRGLVFRTSVRLAGRGEAAQALVLKLEHDRSIAQLRGAEPVTELGYDLAGALWREADLYRVVASRLERLELQAPTVGLRLEVPAITRAATHQLELGRVASGLTATEGESLPVLLAELVSDLGAERVGVLECVDSHRPEAKSRLVPCSGDTPRARRKGGGIDPRSLWSREPTRLLSPPVPLATELRVGATVTIQQQLYSIEWIRFEQRFEATEWWSPLPVSRDYLRLWLESDVGGLEALVYVDRRSGARFLQGIAD